jgi:hypothetical protein
MERPLPRNSHECKTAQFVRVPTVMAIEHIFLL